MSRVQGAREIHGNMILRLAVFIHLHSTRKWPGELVSEFIVSVAGDMLCVNLGRSRAAPKSTQLDRLIGA